MLDQLLHLVSGAWWSYLLVFLMSWGDALVPLVPSEVTVVTAGVVSGAGEMRIELVLVLAALGAFAGDSTAYWLGRWFGGWIRRHVFKSAKAKRRLSWASKQIQKRGGTLILVGRFIPGGRTIVTLTSGWLEVPWRTFAIYAGIASAGWACYAAFLGFAGGKAFQDQPWKGLLLALGVAAVIGAGVETGRWAVTKLQARKKKTAHA